jgi:outer membrane beta-barrel protein
MDIKPFKILLLIGLLFAAPVSFAADESSKPADSAADEKRTDQNVQQLFFGKQIQALQLRYFTKRHRFGISVGGAYNLNDALQHHIGVGGALRFGLTERWALGARYFAYRNIDKNVREQLKNQLHLFPERTDIRMEGQLAVHFSPIDGKFTFFDSGIAYYDVYFTLGGGAMQNFAQKLLPTALVGIGIRFHVTQWMGVELEFNDTLYMESFPGQSTLMQNVSMGLALSFYMPFSPTYRTVPE